MKLQRFFSVALLTLCALSAFGQAKKPTLMVVPSDAWCREHGYTQTFDNQGVAEVLPDYKAAVSTDKQLNAVISKINILMADRDFPLKDLQQTVKSIANLSAEDQLITSKGSGAAIAESPLDRLRRTAKADIILEIDWTVNTVGPKSSITYNLRGLDAYSLVPRVRAMLPSRQKFPYCSKRLSRTIWTLLPASCRRTSTTC